MCIDKWINFIKLHVHHVDAAFALFNLLADVQLLNVLNNQLPNLCFTCVEAHSPSLLMLKYQSATECLISVCTPNQVILVYLYISTVCENKVLALVYCIVLIHNHEMTLY